MHVFKKDKQYIKFCSYGFLKNLRFFNAFLLLFFLENGISYSEIGVLYALREISINIFEIPSGLLADTYGRKNTLLLAFLSYIISFILFYFSTDFYWLLLAMLLFGIGDAFRSGTHKGMIMDYLKIHNWQEYKIAYYGSTRSWSQLGSAIAALFAGFLVFYSGNYRLIYLMSTIPYVLNFFNILSYPKELNFTLKKEKVTKSFASVFTNFKEMLRTPKVFRIINSAALYTSFLKVVKDYIQPIMIQIAVLIPYFNTIATKKKNGLIIGLLYFGIFLTTSLASKNAWKISKLKKHNIAKTTLIIGFVIGAICGVFIQYEFWFLAFLFFVLIYILENIRKPILTGILSDNVPNEILTSVLSAQNFYRTILTSVFAILFGFFVNIFGIGISLLIISSLFLILIRMKKSAKI